MAGVDCSDVKALQLENESLRKQVIKLEARLEFLGKHQTLARGMAGEKLVSRLTGGMLTVHTAPTDLLLENGIHLEIKLAMISRSSKGYAGGRRWQWQKIFGERNGKSYDYLLLLGESDPNHMQSYREPGSPYVMFAVPYDSVLSLTTAGTPPGARAINLSTNPERARGISSSLYSRFERTSAELTSQFGQF